MSGKETFLKDGTRLHQDHLGKLVRFRKGSTALMRVDKIETDLFGKRFYGINIIGDHHAAYAHDCLPADEKDWGTWASYTGDRNACY